MPIESDFCATASCYCPNELQATRSPSNSSVSCTDDSCSVCSPKTKRGRSRSTSPRTHGTAGAASNTNAIQSSNSRSRHMLSSRSPLTHSGKVNGRNGPTTYSSTSLNPAVTSNNSSHHSKQRAISPSLRDEEKRRNHDDKWKGDSTGGSGGGVGSSVGGSGSGGDKLIRERAHGDRHTREPPRVDHSAHDSLSNKHSLSSRLSKSSRAPSLEYVRMKTATEPPVLPIGAKKKLKDKPVDKVSPSILSQSTSSE